MRRIKNLIAAVFVLVLVLPLTVLAKDEEEGSGYAEFTNQGTGYKAILYDEADVLSDKSERMILQQLVEITDYGNAIFYSAVAGGYANESRAQSMSVSYYNSCFSGRSDGVIVSLILDNDRSGGCMLWVESFNKTHKVITTSYANSIADNAIAVTKKHASGRNYYGYDGTRDYYGYANEALTQIHQLLMGQKVAQPMKIVTSALLSMILALLLNFLIVLAFNRKKTPKDKEVLAGLVTHFDIRETQAVLTHTDKRYSPRSSGGGGGHGGGGGGSHGGGGHRG